MQCIICDIPNMGLAWTDTHGVAQCVQCGECYVIYHYVDDKRIEAPPKSTTKPEWIPLLRRYWSETQHRIPHRHSFPGGQDITTQADRIAFDAWMDAHKDEANALVPVESAAS